jgi:anti-anti-sigma regulatory factor
MLKISIVDNRSQRRLVLEGKLTAPWAAELRGAYDNATVDLGGRQLLLDVKNVTVIGDEGETVLLELMNEGVKFRCCGVFTKLILKRIARRRRACPQDTNS